MILFLGENLEIWDELGYRLPSGGFTASTRWLARLQPMVLQGLNFCNLRFKTLKKRKTLRKTGVIHLKFLKVGTVPLILSFLFKLSFFGAMFAEGHSVDPTLRMAEILFVVKH